MEQTSHKAIKEIVTAHRQMEGGGFMVRRPIPSGHQEQVDPFLLLDEMGPVDYAPGKAMGAPEHPHRGFETVTYLLAGEMEHRDSGGHHGVLRPGDVQWMTAGAGVVHSELPTQKMMDEGGRMHGFQLWVNLPRDDKMMAPRYQDITAEQLPEVTSEDGRAWVRVIAGEALDRKAVIETRIPITYLHWKLKPGASVSQAIPAEQDAFIYVFHGSMEVGEEKTPLVEGQMAVLDQGEHITFSTSQDQEGESECLVLAAKPLNEPMTRWGPFVMNHPHEIQQAIVDYQSGRMGQLADPDQS